MSAALKSGSGPGRPLRELINSHTRLSSNHRYEPSLEAVVLLELMMASCSGRQDGAESVTQRSAAVARTNGRRSDSTLR